MKASIILIFALFYLAFAEVYFKEDFGDGWEKRWVKSKNKESEGTQGEWAVSAGKFFNDEKEDRGLQTTKDARFYQISAAFPPFSNKGKTLILQYSVKHEQKIDCGGGYIKILPKDVDQDDFHGDSPYNIMFGPDICGSSTKKTHLIFNYKGKNHLIKKEIKCESDEFTHLYTLILRPDNTYEVQIDSKEVAKGSLKDDWDMLPPKQIKDPKASKPSDWVDEKTIPDPSDKKPEGWDDIPAEVADPEAKKPDDWDDELDGAWEAPMIPNPEYKGEWKPKQIENPAYKGEWVHPMIDNPEYFDDNELYAFKDNAGVGFEVWQVKAGTIFDHILVTNDIKEAEKAAEVVKKAQEGEKKAFDKAEEERKKKDEEERKKKEAEEKSQEEENEDKGDEKDEL
jgi:calreticulin